MKKFLSDKRNKVIILISAISLVLILIGVTYAFWTYTETQKTINKVNTNCLKVEITDVTEAINLEKTYPLTDEEAEKLKPYTFKIENVCNTNVVYDVNLEVMDIENRLNSEYIAVEFNNEAKKLLTSYTSKTPTYKEDDYKAVESYEMTTGELDAGDSVTYTIKLWMDETTPATENTMNKGFISKIIVEATQNMLVDTYKEEILNGADPVLGEGLIPVIIADDGTVTKANIEAEWYNYENQVWANAVILEDESITYNNYDVIPESNIESYFVWIPRYKYKIWNLGTYTSLTSINTSQRHTIDVVFGTDTTSDSNTGECTTPGTSGATGNCGIGDYMTHPAFTSFGTNGIWVGKFESGYKGATSTSGAQVNSSDNTKIQIKPNVYSWRSIQVANAHLASYNYNRDLDSHMMKNTEWGAVAYLQHSKYGSQKSVRINNNSSYLTGYAGVNEPTTGYTATNISCSTTPDECNEYGTSTSITQPYNTETGYLASTTGNITGIYDMSGGAWEYMMGVLADSSGNPMSGRNKSYNSGFLGTYGCPTCDSNDGTASNTDGVEWPNKKYYDLYTYQTRTTIYKNRILGDATGELGPFQSMTYGSQTRQINSWYDDEGWFVNSTSPWFVRGGIVHMGTGAGVFDFSRAYGIAWANYSFRVVLAP